MWFSGLTLGPTKPRRYFTTPVLPGKAVLPPPSPPLAASLVSEGLTVQGSHCPPPPAAGLSQVCIPRALSQLPLLRPPMGGGEKGGPPRHCQLPTQDSGLCLPQPPRSPEPIKLPGLCFTAASAVRRPQHVLVAVPSCSAPRSPALPACAERAHNGFGCETVSVLGACSCVLNQEYALCVVSGGR